MTPVQDPMKIFFAIAAAIYFLNVIVSVAFAVKYKKSSIFRKNAKVWLFFLAAVLLQFAVMSFSLQVKCVAFILISFLGLLAVSDFFSEVFKTKSTFFFDSVIFIISAALTLFFYSTRVNFIMASLPITFFAIYPILKFFPQLMSTKKIGFAKSGMLIFHFGLAAHLLCYPYIADNPELLLYSLMLRLVLAIGASCFTFAALIEREILEGDLNVLLKNTSRLTLLGRMTADISHEIKNPLTILSLNNGQMLNRFAVSNDMDINYFKNKLEVAEKMLGRLMDIMGSLRAHYNSGAADKFKMESISELFEEVSLLSSFRTKKMGIEVNFECHPPNLMFECRAVQIIQVLQNLIQNAIDELEHVVNPKIEIRAVKHEESLIKISVADNGPGIPRNIRARIFEYFFTTKTSDKGSGLGLSISQSFVNEHRGSIYLEDQDKTQFTIDLPIYHLHEIKDAKDSHGSLLKVH